MARPQAPRSKPSAAVAPVARQPTTPSSGAAAQPAPEIGPESLTSAGDLALVLHAHLPYVRSSEPGSLEEDWYFQALQE